jgi:hypothetical protein
MRIATKAKYVQVISLLKLIRYFTNMVVVVTFIGERQRAFHRPESHGVMRANYLVVKMD